MPLSSDRRAVLMRLFGDFALRWFEPAMKDFARDYEGAAVLIAVLQANITAIGEDAALNRLYGAAPPPNDLRQPISLREAARLVGMPRERFRRKAMLIAKAGAILPSGDGYIVPAAMINPTTSRWNAQTVAVLHRRLQREGFDVADIAVTDGQDQWRQGILRVMGEVFVAWVREAPAPLDGDLLLAVVFAAVVQANGYPQADAGQPRPIPVNALAESLFIPRESARRYVADLEARGWLERTPGGVVVAPGALTDERATYVEPLLDLTRRLFARLADQGATFSADYLSATD